MPKQSRKFIDKKNSVTFHLVHRSQQDPLIADETAPQHVLLEAKSGQTKKRLEEQQKFGVYFDDGYDYLQHLRDRKKDEIIWERVEPANQKPNQQSNNPSIQLPSSVFASEFEEEEGLLRKAAPRHGPRPDWDPDIVAALDDDFDYNDPNNQLEDDFVAKALAPSKEDEEYDSNDDEYSECDSNEAGFSDEENDVVGNLPRGLFNNEETKSRFTEYSMSSSVIRRNEQLTLLDDRFEKFYEKYDEPEIGSLDCDDIEGDMEISNDMVLRLAEEFKKEKEEQYENYNRAWDEQRLSKICNEPSSDEELVEIDVEDDKQKKWDCESILSTYSNVYNHPKIIEEPCRAVSKIEINSKTGVPVNVLHGDKGKLTAKTLAKLNGNSSLNEHCPKSLCEGSILSTLSVLSIRPKDETPEEKKERKKLLKEYRTERRLERKANTQAFKEEKVRQEKNKINSNRMQGNKIL